MRRDVPEPWAGWLIDAGLTAPNARRSIPSGRQLAERVGVHPTTIMDMMHGAADTDVATVTAVAKALGVDVRRVSEQVGLTRTEREPWVPPAEVDLLSRRQQRALSEMIRAMAEGREGDGDAALITGDDPADPRLTRRRVRARSSTRQGSTPRPSDETPHPAQP